MARLLVCFLFYCTSVCCLNAQNSLSLNYFKRVNNLPPEELRSFAKGPNGFFFAGFIDTSSPNLTDCSNNGSNGLLVATDNDANFKWGRCYAGGAIIQMGIEKSDGSILAMGGFFTNTGSFPYPQDSAPNMATFIKFDSAGNPQWYRVHGGDGANGVFISTQDGGGLFLNQFNTPGGEIPYKYGNYAFNYDIWLCKLDSGGNIRWSMVLGGSGDQYVEIAKELEPNIYSILINTTSTDYMLAGINHDSINYVPWLLKIDSGGNILSSKVMEDLPDDTFNTGGSYGDFVELENNSIIFVGANTPQPGSYCYPGLGEGDFIFVEADSNYNFQWCALNGGTGDDYLIKACQINDSILVAIGPSASSDDDLSYCSSFSRVGDSHEWIGLYNLNQHKKVWQQCLCGSGEDNVYGLIYDSTENAVYVLVNGNSEDGNFTGLGLPTSNNTYVLKYMPVTTGISAVGNYAANINVFPNPTADYINITCTNLLPGHPYYFTIYDLLGQLLFTQPLTIPSTTLPCSNWQASLYIWQVTDENGNKVADGKVAKE